MPNVRYRDMYNDEQKEAIVDYLTRMRTAADNGYKSCREGYRVSKQDFMKRNAQYYQNVRAGFDWALHWLKPKGGSDERPTDAVQDRIESGAQDRGPQVGRRYDSGERGGDGPGNSAFDDQTSVAKRPSADSTAEREIGTINIDLTGFPHFN